MPLVRNINAGVIAARVDLAIGLSLMQIGEDMVRRSKGPGSPVPKSDPAKSKTSGNLRRSASVTRVGPKQVSVSWNTGYAARINEGKTNNNTPVKKWTTPGTGAGYAEKIVLGATYDELIAREIENTIW